MKKINQLLVAAVLMFSTILSAQAPNLLSYQAVVRNSSNNIVINQSVGMRISVLQGSASGTAVYVETQTATSNANGLVSLQIGGGTVVTGIFANINWAGNTYFVKTETDPAGGTSYSITGTQQLLSVPYALSAKNGVPTGGAANQVLAKVNGTDFNAQWITPTFSSAKLELMVTKNTTQALVSSTSATPDQVTYESVVTTPTLGTYANNAYTVGTNGAGLYLIQTRNSMIDYATPNNTTGAYNFLEVNASAYGSYTNIYPSYVSNVSTRSVTNVAIRSSTQYMFLVNLNAGDVIRIRATGANSSVLQTLSNDGGTQLMVVKL